MASKVTGRLLVALLFTLLVGDLAAVFGDMKISLSVPDQYVYRTFKVMKKSGKAAPGLVMINAFDGGRKSLVFEDVTGRAVTILLSEIQAISFTQDVKEDNPDVQRAWRKRVTAVAEGQRTLTVATREFGIDKGVLVLTEPGASLSLEGAERWEARSMTYDASTDTFALELARVKYDVRLEGRGGGQSGVVKPLP